MSGGGSGPTPVQYRSMLVKVAVGVRAPEMEAMKFMCSEFIPRRRMEEVVSCTDLWTALQEKNLLDPDNLAFLKNLLSSVSGSRDDLIGIITAYEHQMNLVQGNARPASKSIEILGCHNYFLQLFFFFAHQHKAHRFEN